MSSSDSECIYASDDFYENIQAPQFYDFSGEKQENELSDTWFETKQMEESSEEEESMEKPKEKILLRNQPKQVHVQTKPQKAMESRTVKPVRSIRMPSSKRTQPKPSAFSRKLVSAATVDQLPARPTMSKETSKVNRIPATRNRLSAKPTKGPSKCNKKSEDFVFRARPLDRRILESCGDMGVPKLAKIPITRPVSPKLSKSRVSKYRRTIEESKRSSPLRKKSERKPTRAMLPRIVTAPTKPAPRKLVNKKATQAINSDKENSKKVPNRTNLVNKTTKSRVPRVAYISRSVKSSQ